MAWADEGDKIWALRKATSELFNTNPSNVAAQRDFYKSEPLAPEELSVIEDHIFKLIGSEKFSKWIDYFSAIQSFHSVNKNDWEQFSSDDDFGIDFANDMNSSAEKELLELEESLHENIESAAVCYIKSIMQGDISFSINMEGLHEFLRFLMVQNLRTVKAKKEMRKQLKSMGIDSSLFEKAWHIFRFFYAIEEADYLFCKGCHINLLRSSPGMAFITGDQPVVSCKGGYYYPVSPSVAIFVSCEDRAEFSSDMSQSEVQELNKLIRDQCENFLFSKKKEYLIWS